MDSIVVPLNIQETAGASRQDWPVTCGVPFADGELSRQVADAGRFRVLDPAGQPVPCQGEVAATWGTYPDGSNGYVRWMHITFLASVEALAEQQYRLEIGPSVTNPTATDLEVDDGDEAVTVTTGSGQGALRLVISKRRFNVLDEVYLDTDGDGFGPDDRIVQPRDQANLSVSYEHRTASSVDAVVEVAVEQAGPVMAVVRMKAKLDDRFESVVRVFAYAGSSYVRVQETLIHGPTGQDRSAVRSQPVVMKAHVMELPLNVDRSAASATFGIGEALSEPADFSAKTVRLIEGDRAALEQDLTHVCLEGNVGPDRLSKAFGYSMHVGSEQVHEGKRAPGWVDLSDGRWGMTAAVRYFWQTFPKRLSVADGVVSLEHWARGAQLDPVRRNFSWMGMAKTHDVGLYFHCGDAVTGRAETAALSHLGELLARCEPDRYCSTRAYGRQPITPAVQNGKQVNPAHDKLLAGGLNRERAIEDGFYYFREREDGYGYVHFGDFLVGHYWGCQEYDPAYCMLEQFYRTGELKYLEFSVETARHLYDVLYTHSYTPETSNYPQRSHDKSESHTSGEDSHGQREMNTDPGHVFIAGLANYWFLTGDPRAKDVIFWSLPIYIADDWYRMGGGGTWRYLGGYLTTVMVYAYELTWDDRYLELPLWAARQFMVNNRSRHDDGVWWQSGRDGVYRCSPWLADSVTNGFSQLLEVYPGCPYRPQIESMVTNLAEFLLEHSFTPELDGLYAELSKNSRQSTDYISSGSVYRKSMGNMAVLTLARAYYLTGRADRYLPIIRKILQRSAEHTGDLNMLKPVTQGTYYSPMVLPYLEGAISPREQGDVPKTVQPRAVWLEQCRDLLADQDGTGAIYLGDELASACAPEHLRGRAYGNERSWRLGDVMGAIDHVLATRNEPIVVVLSGGSDLAMGHPERTDFEANYMMLVRKIIAAGRVPVLATLPPCSHLWPTAWRYNATIVQTAALSRAALIDLDELLRPSAPAPVNDELNHDKTPPDDWVAQNSFTSGHESVVAAELARIIQALRRA